MKSSFRAMTLFVVTAALFLIVGAASMATAGSQAKVTINVAALRPGSSDDAQKQFNDNVALFERQHPNITVKPVEYAWNGATFAAQLAAGRLPTVFTVPFTDARTLGEHRQVADITAGVKKWPYFKKFQPTIIAEATTSKGRIIGVPYAAYAQALHYNRALFRQAGLNPNKPPTTWAQLRKYAKQISDKTGAAGYAQMGLNDNTAGWIATTVTYTLGGRMERGRGTSATATLNNPNTVQALNLLRQMRWTDKSMGSTFDYTWPTINQAFAAGKIGMFINGSDIYTFLVQAANLDPSIYGIAPLPLAKNKNAGVLGGGSIAVVRPDTKGASRCEHSRREQAACWCSGVPDLQQEAVPGRKLVDQAVHQRSDQPDVAVPQGHLQAEPLLGARGFDAERVPRTRSGRSGGVCRQERQHRGPACAGERSRPEGHQGRELAS